MPSLYISGRSGQTLAPAMAPSFARFSSWAFASSSSQPIWNASCRSPLFPGSILASSSGVYPLKLATILWLSYTKTLSISDSNRGESTIDTFSFSSVGSLKYSLLASRTLSIHSCGIPWFLTANKCKVTVTSQKDWEILSWCVYRWLTIEKPYIHTCIAYLIRKRFPLVLIRTRCTGKIAAMKSAKSFLVSCELDQWTDITGMSWKAPSIMDADSAKDMIVDEEGGKKEDTSVSPQCSEQDKINT